RETRMETVGCGSDASIGTDHPTVKIETSQKHPMPAVAGNSGMKTNIDSCGMVTGKPMTSGILIRLDKSEMFVDPQNDRVYEYLLLHAPDQKATEEINKFKNFFTNQYGCKNAAAISSSAERI